MNEKLQKHRAIARLISRAQKPFDAIIYRSPRLWEQRREISRFVGVDTEAYRDGRPFLFCSSEGHAWAPADAPACFFLPEFRDADFVLYNIKYDSGAILSAFLGRDDLLDLWTYDGITAERGGVKYRVRYIPHKYLAISRGRRVARFWDIAQYFRMSLDAAAKKYLGAGKIRLETKSFTRRYVRENRRRLVRYCIRDARLTRDLAVYFKSKLSEFGIDAGALYSSASLSFAYFHQKTPLIDVWDLYNRHPELVRYAHEAYQGGKFECTQRGAFSGAHEYDLVSAYPFEMYNLRDIRRCRVYRCREEIPDAAYAVLRCRVHHENPAVPSCHGLLIGGVRVYAYGRYTAYLTLPEYRYYRECGVGVDILDGYWLVCRQRYPYRPVIDYLFDIKEKYRESDATLFWLTKLMLNGYYGKFVQLTPVTSPVDDSVSFRAGVGWNPIYAGVITANTRIRMCRLQRALGDGCLAVHTDSILTTRRLGTKFLHDADGRGLGDGLGCWQRKLSGPGLIIGSGMYDMANKTAIRGLEIEDGSFTWRGLLRAHPARRTYTWDQLRVVSWTQACAWDRVEKINLFEKFPKKISLDLDTKRAWEKNGVRGRDLLSGLEKSRPFRIKGKKLAPS